MTPTSTIFLWIWICLIMDTGGVSGQPNQKLKCIHCDLARDKDCIKLTKDTVNLASTSCSAIFDEMPANATNSTEAPTTSEVDWKISLKEKSNEKNTKWVCVKQNVYAASKLPPGVAGEKNDDSWEYGNSVSTDKPTYVSRFCGLISKEDLKNHREVIDHLGGKFAMSIFYCETDDCNRGLKLGHSMGVILFVSSLLAFHFLGGWIC